jgi:hypothetical protein
VKETHKNNQNAKTKEGDTLHGLFEGLHRKADFVSVLLLNKAPQGHLLSRYRLESVLTFTRLPAKRWKPMVWKKMHQNNWAAKTQERNTLHGLLERPHRTATSSAFLS